MTDAAKLTTMARYLAHKAVREHLRDCCIRPMEIEPAELRKATDALLLVRRAELIAEAKAILSR